MPHATRALRRASEAASAHAAVRPPLRALTIAVAGLASAALAVGAAAGPVAAAEHPEAAGQDQAAPVTGGVMAVVERATDVLDEAETTLAEARALKRQVVASGLPVEPAVVAIETARLQSAIDDLRPDALAPVLVLPTATSSAEQVTHSVAEHTGELRAAFQAAQEKKAAEDAARAAAEAAAAAEAQRAAEEAAALAAANTPDGAKATARQMAASQYGWGDGQFSCLESLWTKESCWNYQAYNPSGATGIPQALPGNKMASAGSDWQSNATTQITWGLGYIADVYGTPCSAWSHSQATDWY